MKKLGDTGANPTMQIDLADLDDARLEALVKADDGSEPPPAGRAVPPPLPPFALTPQAGRPAVEPAPAPPRRSNVVLIVALFACLAVGFAAVAVLRKGSAQATPAAAKPTSSVLTIPTVDMSDDAPPKR